MKRPGVTLIELLIAMLIGGSVVAVAISQLFNYFRVQSQLIARTELREEVKVVQDKVDDVLKYACVFDQVPGQGYIALVPRDVDHCGRLCYLDTFDIYWWYVKDSSLNGGLVEQVMKDVPAFYDPPDVDVLKQMFAKSIGTLHPMGKAISAIQITTEPGPVYHTVIGGTRTVAKQPPINIALQEYVAPRSLPLAMQGMPSFIEVATKILGRAPALKPKVIETPPPYTPAPTMPRPTTTPRPDVDTLGAGGRM